MADGEALAVGGDRRRGSLLRPAALGGVLGVALVIVGVLVLQATSRGSSNGPSCTMERTAECLPEGMGRAFELVLVLLAVLVVAGLALVVGLVLLLVVGLSSRHRPEPPSRGMRVLVAVAAGLAAGGATVVAVVFLS